MSAMNWRLEIKDLEAQVAQIRARIAERSKVCGPTSSSASTN
jgi:hypothetical protein